MSFVPFVPFVPIQVSLLEERVAQLSDSLAALRAEQRALRHALCAAAPQQAWADAWCDRTHGAPPPA
jgi:hypothetical protein